jgi:hypothetical protein
MDRRTTKLRDERLYFFKSLEKFLIQLARHNRVQLIGVPGDEGIAGSETADHLARTGSEHSFTGPEPACGMSFGVAKRAVKDWINKKKKNQILGIHKGTQNRQRN